MFSLYPFFLTLLMIFDKTMIAHNNSSNAQILTNCGEPAMFTPSLFVFNWGHLINVITFLPSKNVQNITGIIICRIKDLSFLLIYNLLSHFYNGLKWRGKILMMYCIRKNRYERGNAFIWHETIHYEIIIQLLMYKRIVRIACPK